jgi:hypothetical protein
MTRQACWYGFIVFLATIAVACAAYLLAGQEFNQNFATAFAGLVTGFGVIVALVTLRHIKEANSFSLIAILHARFNDSPSYECRGYLFDKFGQDLAEAAVTVFGKDSAPSGFVDIDWILENVDEDPDKERDLNSKLKIPSCVGTMTALQAVERVLLDYDLLAVPFCDGNVAVRSAARAFKPQLQQTSEIILLFVAIKMKLRGQKKSYKYHYLKMLHDLKIPLPRNLPFPRQP